MLRENPTENVQDDRFRKYIGMNDAARLSIVGADGGVGNAIRVGVFRRLHSKLSACG